MRPGEAFDSEATRCLNPKKRINPMDRQTELAIVRRAFAKQILAAAQVNAPQIEAAFAAVRREEFLGPGPWHIFRLPSLYVATPEADPVLLYVDQVVGLIPERGINNGQPSLHALLLAAAQIKEGEHVVHVGPGAGYYTAIMAHLAGPTGRVTAIEYDSGLAARARENLSSYATVRVLEGNGATMPFDPADVIYVNAGVTHPADTWLDGLSDDGRLILPLTTDANIRSITAGNFDPMKAMRSGAFFRIKRRGAQFEARGLLPTAIIPAEGARDKIAETALVAAFDKGGWNAVTRLVRGEGVTQARCWLRGPGWCLAFD
jgi:protein-L-isoaspartate(D-aspartate) O-methyltransferase